MLDRQRFNYSLTRTLVRTVLGNVLLIGLLLVSQRLSGAGGILVSVVIGSISFVVPGFILALVAEQLSRRRESVGALCLWGAIYSVTIIPAAVYSLIVALPERFSFLQLVVPFIVVWIACLLLLLIVVSIIRTKSGAFDRGVLDRQGMKQFVIAGVALVAILGVNFLLYRFIPEGDGYGYLLTLRRVAIDPAILIVDPRKLFLIVTQLLATLLRLDPYWILKLVIPLGSGVITIATMHLATVSLVRKPALRVIAVLSPFGFPVFLQELLIARPQSLVVAVLVPTIYLLGNIVVRGQDKRQLYWLFSLAIAGCIGLKIHALFVVVILLAGCGIGALLWSIIRSQPIDAFIVLLGTSLLAWPWLHAGRILDGWYIFRQFLNIATTTHFRWWFLDNYRNIDGNLAGWPGWTSLLYYGYNVGLLLPIVLAGAAWSRRRLQRQPGAWPAWIVLFSFLIVAEVLPRFHYAYLPDRAWLFIAIACSFLLPQWLLSLDSRIQQQKARMLLGIIALSSIVAGSAVTYAKQGWITPGEYQAVDFIRTNTPPDARFFGQGGSRVLIRYFANRILLPTPAALFLSDDQDAIEQYLVKQQQFQEQQARRRFDDQVAFGQQVVALGQQYQRATSAEERAIITKQEATVVDAAITFERGLAQPDETTIPPGAPMYAIYSADKFSSLYGQRAWWRTSNLYGANTDKLSLKYPLIYNHKGVMIWKVR